MSVEEDEIQERPKVLPLGAQSFAPEEAPPERIGRYELRYELAAGGMASVYLAQFNGVAGFNKLVALKRIHRHLAKEKAYMEMFLDEAKIASRITHPNVCSVFDFCEADGEYYLAMEYLVGEPLSRVCVRVASSPEQRRDPLLPLRMARIIADACEGLHAAHELKDAHGDLLHVVHRDVSSRNLFVTYVGGVQVVDFGLASARERLHQTSTGEVKGTLAYMAPEQLKAKHIDRRTDIWALGVALWETLAIQRLFKRDTTADTMYAVFCDEVLPPSRHNKQVPKELDEIVLKALKRDPNERWQTAREMGRALRRFLGTQQAVIDSAELSEWMAELFPQGEARKSQLLELARLARGPVLSIPVANEFAVTLAAPPMEELPPRSNPRRSRRTVIALVAGALATAALIAVLFARGDPSPSVEPPKETVAEAAPAEAPPTEVAQPPEPEATTDPVIEPIEVRQAEATPAPKALPERAPKVEKTVRKPRARPKPSPVAEPGTIKLVTRGGSAEIFKGKKSLGSTPSRLTLPPGRHKLVLKPFGDGEPKPVFVEVEAGKTKRVLIRLE